MFFKIGREFKVLHLILKNNFSSSIRTNTEFYNGVKKITLCDQKTRNSLSLAMMEDLLENINKDKNNQDLRIIILAADGPVFSAGHNLKELVACSTKATSEAGRPQHEKIFRICSELMYSIIDCPVPIIAQVDGLAAAAGCQLVAQCDIVLCTENSKFSTPGANFGIFCSTPGIPIARKVRKSTALNMLLTGLPITAAEAKSSGLVTSVHSKEDLENEIKVICDAIISKSRSVIELGKRFYYKQVDLDIKKAYKLGAIQMVENLEITDGKEGVRSFVEKRKPIWSHSNC
ncbi:hypothetical protein NQ314_007833 [Rhamnusium bicolor]|uniref:Enoyl-CoA hydratase domain-containing protein 3, mitochondrial n=1 Tax=Rhamnusium bicolor TaxID=1586634 RepID=A0AAV8YI15_9CUCU|nr:hypothetical protein NQ314_007833 [Rhamnusium bicolor]